MTLKPLVLMLELPTMDGVDDFIAFVGAELSHEGIYVRQGWSVLATGESVQVRATLNPPPGLNAGDAVRRALQDAPITPESWRLREALIYTTITNTKEVQHG